MLWESSKSQFGRPKKKGRQNFEILENFLKIRPPPRENPRFAPGDAKDQINLCAAFENFEKILSIRKSDLVETTIHLILIIDKRCDRES